ncbi:MAG: hypothetical protein WAN12_07485 [Candidatus Acidiferrum sp.]
MLLAVLLTSTLVIAQTPPKKATHRANELTLAGLRPGRDRLSRAVRLYRNIDPKSSTNDSQTIWLDPCRKQLLAIDFDTGKKIEVIRAGAVNLTADCLAVPPSPWKTGRGLRLGDATTKVTQLYGEPDSRSPSTRDGQPLELWYYAFDWAGPDVPQVMEVLCTKEKDGQAGHVVEITLAAPSL